MTTILVIGAFQALFFTSLLLVKKSKTLCDSVLAIWLGLLFIHLMIIYCKYLGLYEEYPHLIGTTSSLIFLYGPMLFFYVDNYTSNFPGFRKVYFFHFIPFVIHNIYKLPFYLKSADEKLLTLNTPLEHYEPIEIVFYILKAAIIPFYVVMILALLKKHRNNLQYYFSNFEKKDLMWVKYLVWSIALIGIIVIFTGIAKIGDSSILTADSEQFVLAATSVWVFALGFYAVKQTSIFVDVTYAIAQPTEKVASSEAMQEYKLKKLAQFENENFEEKLNSHLQNDKPFLQNKLTIDQLASNLEVTTHELSLFINDKMKQSFFDLINGYRVSEFIEKMNDPKNDHYTLLGIAMDSGFSSKASLNRIFKKHTGKSPSEYLKTNRS